MILFISLAFPPSPNLPRSHWHFESHASLELEKAPAFSILGWANYQKSGAIAEDPGVVGRIRDHMLACGGPCLGSSLKRLGGVTLHRLCIL